MAKFTFTRDLLERQPGPKRHYKDWKAGETYTMTTAHAQELESNGYGKIVGREEVVGSAVSDGSVLGD